MTMPETALGDLLRDLLLDVGTQWTVGSFGAIAEFMRDEGEAVWLSSRPGPIAAVTARGGIAFGELSQVRPFASETAVRNSWSHRISLCLPQAACAMHQRDRLTDLGPDADALREEDRSAILFDIGLARLQVDVCIRTGDPDLIALLRLAAGRSVFEHGNPAMAAIVKAGPHRVFISRFARAEVYQPIPLADGKSPVGPHTHVLPKLLRAKRTHAANEPVPNGFVPCAHVIPPHPIRDANGFPRPWDDTADTSFRSLLDRFGGTAHRDLGRRLEAAIAANESPLAFVAPDDRFGRHAMRASLRRLAARPGPPSGIGDWLAIHDNRGTADELDPVDHA